MGFSNQLLKRFSFNRYLSTWLVAVIDVLMSTLATFFTILIVNHQCERHISAESMTFYCLLSLVASAMAFYMFKTYRNIIRYSRLRDVMFFGLASVVKDVLVVVGLCLSALQNDPLRYQLDLVFMTAFMDTIITFTVLVGVRSVMVFVYEHALGTTSADTSYSNPAENLLIYGVAEDSVSLNARLRSYSKYNVCGFCSSDEGQKGLRIENMNVYQIADQESFLRVVRARHIKAILFPNTSSIHAESDRLIAFCERQKLQVLLAPPVDNLDNRSTFHVREVEVEDLLDRPEIIIDMEEVKSMLRNKTILVTGAAGSIGSEICRQLVKVGASSIILFDSAETPMHNLRLEMEDRFPYQRFTPIIGDVRSEDRLAMVFEKYRPQVVFHAAAYKHVPLMEENPCEAIMVNVMGTRNVADACVKYGIEKMIMISTDKAVNPTNIMGTSKRMAEIYVQSLGKAISQGLVKGSTKFVTTRFGNVLGSNGSVLPRFREQIANGGPVTVTHPEIIRFFMSIPEACRLVLEAGTLGHDNEIFVFDMGAPVKIADLARRMISLSGLQEGVDIKIEYTGLRPGEKLYEEVLSDKENTLPTLNQKIRIAQARQYDYQDVCQALDRIVNCARKVEIPEMVHLVRDLVPEYVSKNSWLAKV